MGNWLTHILHQNKHTGVLVISSQRRALLRFPQGLARQDSGQWLVTVNKH